MDGRKLAAALLVCLCFGSIHAYGVLLAPLEQWLGISRTAVSLCYSLALLSLTAGVYVNGRLESGLGSRSRLLACGALAALGLALASAASGAAGLLVGYGLMFGLANGVAYAMSLSIAAAAMPGRAARGMGLATAAYGLGAVLSAQLFAACLQRLQVGVLLFLLAPAVMLACAGAAALPTDGAPQATASRPTGGATPAGLLRLWAAYLVGAFAGLMVLAHAPAIVLWRGGAGDDGGLVSGIVSLGSVFGGYLGGMASERLGARVSLALAVLAQALLLGLLPFVPAAGSVLVALGLAGLCYGVLISAIPAEVRRMSGAAGFATSYGRVFSAWGIAGITGPVMAGALYDLTHSYRAALLAASVLSLLSCGLFSGLRRKDSQTGPAAPR